MSATGQSRTSSRRKGRTHTTMVVLRGTMESITRQVNALAWDEGNRHAKAHGRGEIWSRADYNAAARFANQCFAAIGMPS